MGYKGIQSSYLPTNTVTLNAVEVPGAARTTVSAQHTAILPALRKERLVSNRTIALRVLQQGCRHGTRQHQ